MAKRAPKKKPIETRKPETRILVKPKAKPKVEAVVEVKKSKGLKLRKCQLCKEMVDSKYRIPLPGGETICMECYRKLG